MLQLLCSLIMPALVLLAWALVRSERPSLVRSPRFYLPSLGACVAIALAGMAGFWTGLADSHGGLFPTNAALYLAAVVATGVLGSVVTLLLWLGSLLGPRA